MKRAAPVALLAILLAFLGACGGRRAAQPTVVEFWQPWSVEALAPLLARFESENPGLKVHVRVLAGAGSRDTIAASLAAGVAPDLCALDSTSLPELLAAGELSDWSAGVADQRDSLHGWTLCRVGDALYGMPWLLDTRALFYDRSLFSRARLDPARPPLTWAELAGAAARVQRLGGGVRGYGLASDSGAVLFESFGPYAWANGGEVFSSALDSVAFDSPANVAALELLSGMRAASLVAPQDSLENEFVRGRLGMVLGGAALLDRLERGAPASRWGVALVPVPPGDSAVTASVATGVVLASFTRSPHKEAALRLARFLVSAPNSIALAAAVPWQLSPRVGADSAAAFAGRPARRALLRQLASARMAPPLPEWPAMARAIGEELAAALAGRKSSAQAIAAAGTRLGTLLGKSQR